MSLSSIFHIVFISSIVISPIVISAIYLEIFIVEEFIHPLMETVSVKIDPPAETQIILAQSYFIKTVEDAHECLVNCVPNIKFGIGINEANGPCLISILVTLMDLNL